GRERRLRDGRREQLRRDAVGAAHRRREEDGAGRGRGREAAVPPARRHARELVLRRRARNGGGVLDMSATTRLYDRREILADAASAAAIACVPCSSPATPSLGAERREPLADWSIDDQWGVVPRWDAIPCNPQHRDDARHASAQPIDAPFLV